jgi:hypothetical protein
MFAKCGVITGLIMEVAYSGRYAPNFEYEPCWQTVALRGVAYCTVIAQTAVFFVNRCNLTRAIADLYDPYLPRTPPSFLSGRWGEYIGHSRNQTPYSSARYLRLGRVLTHCMAGWSQDRLSVMQRAKE